MIIEPEMGIIENSHWRPTGSEKKAKNVGVFGQEAGRSTENSVDRSTIFERLIEFQAITTSFHHFATDPE